MPDMNKTTRSELNPVNRTKRYLGNSGLLDIEESNAEVATTTTSPTMIGATVLALLHGCPVEPPYMSQSRSWSTLM
jgi:hypothetical protein